MISLREHLRIHKASLDVVIQKLKEPLDELKIRLHDTFRLLEYYDVTATALLEQQQNLLSLVSMSLSLDNSDY
jgi:hypothetical protein